MAVCHARHELARAPGVSYEDCGRGAAEVLVEAVTSIVLASQGFDVEGPLGAVRDWLGPRRRRWRPAHLR
jgi:hypothetical protein